MKFYFNDALFYLSIEFSILHSQDKKLKELKNQAAYFIFFPSEIKHGLNDALIVQLP